MSKQQPTLLSETNWHWSDDSIVASSAAGSSIVRLPELHRWLIGKASIVLLPQDRMLLILPRRVLTDDQARDIEDTLGRFARKTRRA
ncbi:YcxB-like protein [Sphingomonas sp. NFR15]|nr:YcxB-like protein [Sphingomonas sp. NFR15]